jgi:hypothetical protein
VRRASRRARVAALLLAAAGAGCEYFRDSPEQELANRRWRECASPLRDVKLDRVDVDGRIRFTYVAINERDTALACLAAAARADRPLPEPVASAAAGK